MFETLPSLNNCSHLVLDPSKHLTCLPVSSLPLSHLVSMLWLGCLSQRQIWSHLSLKSLWCPFIVLVMKPRSLNWLMRPVVNRAFLATLSTPHLVLSALALKKTPQNAVPTKDNTSSLSLFQAFSLTFLSAGAVVLSSSSLPPILSSSLLSSRTIPESR